MPLAFDSPPVDFSVPNYQDSDTYALDCTDNMLTRQNQIASVGTAVVTRSDGFPVSAGDHTVSAAQILAVGTAVDGQTVQYPGTWFAWTGTGGEPNVGYYITWPLVLSKNGSTIYRTVGLNCRTYVG